MFLNLYVYKKSGPFICVQKIFFGACNEILRVDMQYWPERTTVSELVEMLYLF